MGLQSSSPQYLSNDKRSHILSRLASSHLILILCGTGGFHWLKLFSLVETADIICCSRIPILLCFSPWRARTVGLLLLFSFQSWTLFMQHRQGSRQSSAGSKFQLLFLENKRLIFIFPSIAYIRHAQDSNLHVLASLLLWNKM